MTIHCRAILLTLLALWAGKASADGFTPFGDHEKMLNQAIIFAGEATQVERNIGQAMPEKLLKIQQECFKHDGYLGYWGFGDKPALVLMDAQKNLSIAVLNYSFSSIEAKLYRVVRTKC